MTATRYTYTDEQDDTLRIEPRNSEPGVYIGTSGAGVYVKPEDAARVAAELLKAADMSGVVLPGELPEVKEWDNRTVAVFGGTYLVDGETADPAFWFERAKINLAIAHYVAARAEAKKAEEATTKAKLAARRDKLAAEVADDNRATYATVANSTRGAIDHIIGLEDRLAEAGA
jgi:hypothetical protein